MLMARQDLRLQEALSEALTSFQGDLLRIMT